jgi:hypothetical protein
MLDLDIEHVKVEISTRVLGCSIVGPCSMKVPSATMTASVAASFRAKSQAGLKLVILYLFPMFEMKVFKMHDQNGAQRDLVEVFPDSSNEHNTGIGISR